VSTLSEEVPQQAVPGPGPEAGSDDLFRLVAESSRDLIIVGRPGRHEWVSPSVEEILGFGVEEFLTMEPLDLVHPEDLAGLLQARRRLMVGEVIEGRLRILHRDGSWRWLDARVRPLAEPDGSFAGRSLSSWRDVTQEVEAHDLLQASEERYRLLVEHVGDGVVHERDGVIVWASPNLRRMLGWDPDRWLGRGLLDLVDPASRPELEAALAVSDGREAVTFRVEVPDVDGDHHWLEISARPFVGPDGRLDGNACAVRLIDAQVAAEAELERRARHDALTGLLNRSEVLHRLDTLGTDARRAGRETAVLFCDLDDFKAVNDTFGHSTGDCVLREVAERVRSAVRDTDLVARLGGDELLVVLQHLHGADEALAVADQIRAAVAPAIVVAGGVVSVGISIGVAMVVPGDSSDDVITRADAAMYRVKQGSRAADPQLPFGA